MDTKSLIEKQNDYIVKIRREFHKYAEPSWKEVRTSQRIKEELDKMSIPYKTVAKTGVVAYINGSNKGKTVALRADIDALEVIEKNDLEYKSINDGIMHACGHDGHAAMLLGAAKVLSENKEHINGNVRLLFQPAEEVVEGAKALIKEGVLDDVDGLLGIHLWSGVKTGNVSVEEGPRMASGDSFKIKITEKKGHNAVDLIAAGSAIVRDLQSIVSRETSPLKPSVVSVGVFNSDTNLNATTKKVILEGTVRCYSYKIRADFPKMLERISKNTANTYNAEAELEFNEGVPPTINNPYCSAIAKKSVEKILSKDAVFKLEKTTGGEDLSYYLEKVPGLIAFVGSCNKEKKTDFPHHNGNFNIDEDSLVHGAGLYVQFALDFLNE